MRALPLLVLCVASGCFLTINDDELTGGERAPVDSGGDADVDASSSPPDAGDDSSLDDVQDAGADADAEADADADARVNSRCPNGTSFEGKTAFTFALDGGSGVTCNADYVLVRDNKFVGLDRTKGSEGVLDGKNVTGCVGIELDGLARVAGVKIHAASVDDACGTTPCSEVAPDAGCGTGHTLYVFAGPNRDTLTRAGLLSNIDKSADYVLEFDGDARDVRTIVACREGWNADRDDIGIDYLAGFCE